MRPVRIAIDAPNQFLITGVSEAGGVHFPVVILTLIPIGRRMRRPYEPTILRVCQAQRFMHPVHNWPSMALAAPTLLEYNTGAGDPGRDYPQRSREDRRC